MEDEWNGGKIASNSGCRMRTDLGTELKFLRRAVSTNMWEITCPPERPALHEMLGDRSLEFGEKWAINLVFSYYWHTQGPWEMSTRQLRWSSYSVTPHRSYTAPMCGESSHLGF